MSRLDHLRAALFGPGSVSLAAAAERITRGIATRPCRASDDIARTVRVAQAGLKGGCGCRVAA